MSDRPSRALPALLSRGQRRGGTILLAITMVLATLSFPTTFGFAHEAHGLAGSTPEDGAVIETPPAFVEVRFTSDIVEDRSSLQVINPGGANIALGAPTVDGGAIRVDVSQNTPQGLHRILYDVTVRDGDGFHSTDGELTYSIRLSGCAKLVRVIDQYTSIAAPEFENGPETITVATVDRTFQDLLYATNGRELHRSEDGGCNWEKTLDLGDTDLSAGARITNLETAGEMPGAISVLALEPIDAGTGLWQPVTFWSAQTGRPLAQGGESLPPILLDPALAPGCRLPQSCSFVISHAPPAGLAAPLYFAASLTNGTAQVFRSDDLGATFQPSNPLVAEQDPTALLERRPVIVSPAQSQPNVVVASTGRTIHLSRDLGQSFTAAYTLESGDAGVITHLAAGRTPDERNAPYPDVVAVVSSGLDSAPATAALRLRLTDEGLEPDGRIDLAPLGGAAIDSLARGAQPGQILFLPDGDGRPGVFEYERAVDELRDLDAFDVSPWRNGDATNPICSRWFGHDDTRLYLTDADDGHLHVHDAGDFCAPGDIAGGGGSVDVTKFPSRKGVKTDAVLSPGREVIELAPGESEAVGYRLERASEDVPLDVAFLFDTSGSMRDNLEQVRTAFEDIVSELEERDVDAWFGLAEFMDYKLIRYRRLADIRPPDQEFAEALALIDTSSGEDEPHLTALEQLATGKGITNPVRGANVRPGQDMNWRPDAVRVVIMASDEPIHDENGKPQDPNGPSMEETIQALADRDVMHIGLHIRGEIGDGQGNTGVDDPSKVVLGDRLRQEMEQLSEGTGALAAEPVDCNGDGRSDIQPGGPLVCTMNNDAAVRFGLEISNAFAGALSDLVDAIHDHREFRLQAEAPDGFTAEVTAAGLQGEGAIYPAIDVNRPQNLLFSVNYSCTARSVSTQAEIPLTAYVGNLAVASATATVLCGPQIDPPTVVRAPGQPPARAAVLPPPPPAPPPAPIPANAPAQAASQANAQAASQAAAQAQAPSVAAAVAPQAQQQRQEAEIRRNDGRELQFSALRTSNRGGDSVPIALAAGAAMAIAAGAFELQRRRARQRAHSPVRADHGARRYHR